MALTEEQKAVLIEALGRERAGYEARDRVAVDELAKLDGLDPSDPVVRRRRLELELERERVQERVGRVDDEVTRLGGVGRQTRPRRSAPER